jgi:uracil-DNA glycosylase
MTADRTEQLRAIKDEVVNLTGSPLYAFRVAEKNHPVIGEGSHQAKVMLIGEAPGRNEAATGRPFCGAAGKILDELLTSAGITREEVYITNIVKDRPPQNRDPLPEEIEVYGPFLDRQIEIIQPKVIATLGRFSMKYILEKFGLPEATQPIGKLHGKSFSARAAYGTITIVPLYHPAAAIYDRSKMADLKADFMTLRAWA